MIKTINNPKQFKIKKNKKKFNISQAIIVIILFFLVLIVLYPFYLMIINSLKIPSEYITNPLGLPKQIYKNFYRIAWISVKNYFLNTIFIAIFEILGMIIVCSMAAYGFTRYKFKGREFLFMCILSLMMIPGVLTLIPQYALIGKLNLLKTLWGVIIPTVATGLAFGIFLLRSFFQNIPNDLYEAAEIDGATNVKKLLVITLPLSMPILFTLGLTALLTAWNDLIWARLVLMGSEELYTISVGIMSLTNTYGQESFGMGVPLAAYVIVSIPLVLAFFFTSKQFISGLTSGAFKM